MASGNLNCGRFVLEGWAGLKAGIFVGVTLMTVRCEHDVVEWIMVKVSLSGGISAMPATLIYLRA